MAFTIGNIAAKDSAGTAVGGGLLAADIAGGGVGPWFLFHGLVDGLAGSNRAQVTSGNALKVDPAVAFYTEDAAAASDPVGPVLMAVRRDTLSASEVSADGDNIALKATSKGQAHTALADGAHATFGLMADAKSTATDTTAISAMSVWKQVSASAQAVATALGAAAFTRGAGPSDGNTLRVTLDNTQTEGNSSEWVDHDVTNQVMGGSGAVGDFLSGVLIVPLTTSPGAVAIKDGSSTARNIFTGGASSVSNLTPIYVPLGFISASGAWQITTGANVTAFGAGKFT
jgi:hypothetical protein